MEIVEILLGSMISELEELEEIDDASSEKRSKAEELVLQLINKDVNELVNTMSFEDLIYLQQNFASLFGFLSNETYGERSIKLARQCKAQHRRKLL